MKAPLSWLREFVDLPESVDEIREALDDLGLVVEGIEHVGEGLEDVVVARVDEIHAIDGADRIRRVVVDAGAGPLEIVCGATNFQVGEHVPLAPVGAVLPGDFAIARRTMRGVVSNGMLCSARELRLNDDHEGLMVLDSMIAPRVGERLVDALGLESDVVFDLSIEGNRPDAWSMFGVARDLAARFQRPLREPAVATPNPDSVTADVARGEIEAPDLCGRLTVSVLRNVRVVTSPSWVVNRLERAGMRPISNVVDASNVVMLELGQPTHPYDAHRVVGRTLRVRRARPGESLVTLDGVTRTLATPGRGLGDTGEDCVITDGADQVLGLAGIMGGETSEISDSTTEVLLEAAYFDPMTIARSSKRHGLRSEASNRFERGVDPELALRAVARFVAVLRESVPDLEWVGAPIDVRGVVPTPSTVTVGRDDVERSLGTALPANAVIANLEALGFSVIETNDGDLSVVAPSSRPDIRTGAAGRADVIEEVARVWGYRRLSRHTPTWSEPGAMTDRQRLRRRVRAIVADAGTYEAWTPTLVSESSFSLTHDGSSPVRITNPLAQEESILRPTMVTGLVAAWGRNVERGFLDVRFSEVGVVFTHPRDSELARRTRGGAGGSVDLALPRENERLTVVLGHSDDDASSAVVLWSMVANRLGLADVVVRPADAIGTGVHPTRSANLVDRASGAIVGVVGEVDPQLIASVTGHQGRRLGLLDLDLDVLADTQAVARRSALAVVPSRYPSAVIDLAFVTPQSVHAADLGHDLAAASPLVESVTLFDVYHGAVLAPGNRSLAYTIRLGAPDRTLSDAEVAGARETLIAVGADHGAILR